MRSTISSIPHGLAETRLAVLGQKLFAGSGRFGIDPVAGLDLRFG